MVVCVYTSSGFSTVEGKSGWFGESGKCWHSNATALCCRWGCDPSIQFPIYTCIPGSVVSTSSERPDTGSVNLPRISCLSLPSSELQALAIQAEAVIQSRLAASIDRQRLLALRGRAEVKRSTFDRGSLTSRNHIDHRQISVSVHLEKKRVDLGLEIARHVPVSVVCHVDHGATCRSSLVFQLQLVSSVQREGDVHLHE